MIFPTFSSGGTGRAQPERVKYQSMPRPLAPPSVTTLKPRTICLQTGRLGRSELRPEIVARAKLLAADPNYPPMVIIRHVAERLLATQLNG